MWVLVAGVFRAETRAGLGIAVGRATLINREAALGDTAHLNHTITPGGLR
jgi:hypothetical protein